MRVHGVEERRRKTEQAPGRAAQLLDFLIEVPAAHPSGARSVAEFLSAFKLARTKMHGVSKGENTTRYGNGRCGGGVA